MSQHRVLQKDIEDTANSGERQESVKEDVHKNGIYTKNQVVKSGTQK